MSNDVRDQSGGRGPRATIERVVGEIEDLRPKFEPFGLGPHDEAKWGKLCKVLPALAAKYRTRHEPAPSFTGTADNLKRFRDGLSQAVDALRDLSAPGRDFIVGAENGHDVYDSRGPDGFAPKFVRQENWDTYNKAFELQLIKEKQSQKKAELLAYSDDFENFLRVQKAYDSAKAAYGAHKADPGARHRMMDMELDLWCAGQMLEDPFPSHGLIEGKLTELSALRDLALAALDMFEKSWARSGGGGPKAKFKPKTPGRWLVDKLVELIDEFWGIAGLARISAARDGKPGKDAGRFYELLQAFHEYAGDPNGSSLVESLKHVNEAVYLALENPLRYSPRDPQVMELAQKLERSMGGPPSWR